MRKFITLLLGFFCFSCATTESLKVAKIKNQEIVRITEFYPDEGPVEFYLKKFEIGNDPKKVLIELKDNIPQIKLLTKAKKNEEDSIPIPYDLAMKIDPTKFPDYRIPYEYEFGGIIGELQKRNEYFNDSSSDIETTKSLGEYSVGSKFKYFEKSANFQSITIPFKVRPSEGDIPTQITTGVNIGLSYAFKKRIKRYSPISVSSKEKPIGYKDGEFEFGYAPFFGVTTVNLTPTNTNEAISENLTVFGISYGGILGISVNKLDLGLALGFDTGFGSDARAWIYQSEPWLGIVIGIDLIK